MTPRRPGDLRRAQRRQLAGRARAPIRCSPRRCCARSACPARTSASAWPRTTSPARSARPKWCSAARGATTAGRRSRRASAARAGAARRGLLDAPPRDRRGPRWPARSTTPPPRRRYPRPQPTPDAPSSAGSRVSVTALDRLRARSLPVLRLARSCGCASSTRSTPSRAPAWQGDGGARDPRALAQARRRPLAELADEELREMNAHPLMRALWRPRLLEALEWVEAQIAADPERVPAAVRARRARSSVAGVDASTAGPTGSTGCPTARSRWSTTRPAQPPTRRARSRQGYALQLGTLGLMARARRRSKASRASRRGSNTGRSAAASTSETGFGYVATPILEGAQAHRHPARASSCRRRERYPRRRARPLDPRRASRSPRGSTPTAPGYADYDQLMRLDEWLAARGATPA